VDIQPYSTTEELHVGRPWLLNTHGNGLNQTITLDLSKFELGTHYTGPSAYQPENKLKSGLPLGRIAASGLYAPYAGPTNEVTTVTVTGAPTGGTFTLTWGGQTTSDIAYNATAATVQAALEALSNIAPGDVTVTGNAGGPYTLTWGGENLGDDVAAPTADGTDLTGGTTPSVTVTTTTAGGAAGASDGTQIFVGFLATETAFYPGTTKVGAALIRHGQVSVSKLPVPFDPADLPAGSNTHIIFED
jgi:hypothetical protein